MCVYHGVYVQYICMHMIKEEGAFILIQSLNYLVFVLCSRVPKFLNTFHVEKYIYIFHD